MASEPCQSRRCDGESDVRLYNINGLSSGVIVQSAPSDTPVPLHGFASTPLEVILKLAGNDAELISTEHRRRLVGNEQLRYLPAVRLTITISVAAEHRNATMSDADNAPAVYFGAQRKLLDRCCSSFSEIGRAHV